MGVERQRRCVYCRRDLIVSDDGAAWLHVHSVSRFCDKTVATPDLERVS